MNNFRKQLIYRIGNVLALAGIVFVGIKLFTYGENFNISLFDSKDLAVFLILLTVCGFSNVFLVFAWTNILSHLGGPKHWRPNFIIYGISQISKYIPGNIFHFVSRQALGVTAGIPGGTYFKATIFELILISSGGALLSTYLLSLLSEILSVTKISVILILSLATSFLLASRVRSLNVVYAFTSYLVYLMILSFVFVIVLTLSAEPLSFQFKEVIILSSAYIFSWVIGFAMPGAPAGLGVREFVLLILLENLVPEDALLNAILLSRIFTVGGDFIFFIYALFLKYRK